MLVGITPAEDSQPLAGLAVDLGTTRVALRLLDLTTHRTLAETAFSNPQEAAGPDILSRIHFAEKKDGLKELNRLIVDGDFTGFSENSLPAAEADDAYRPMTDEEMERELDR